MGKTMGCWRRLGSNIEDIRTEEEKIRDRRKAFKNTIALHRMKTIKKIDKDSKESEE